MLIDTRKVHRGYGVAGDVCIVGAGVAGITLARELAARGHSVVLLESGGFDEDRENRRLYEGTSSSNLARLDDAYLYSSRVRHFGGSSNHWGGQCRPLEPIDFERRDWIPHSGWPFPRTALDPWYERASDLLGFGRFTEDDPDHGDPEYATFIGNETFAERVFRFRATRFGQRFRKEIVEEPRISLHLHANAVEIALSPDRGRVSDVVFGLPEGRRFRARARHFVLATGGIENARLLLASSSVRAPGIGNQHDLVGRYFMDHLVTHIGVGPMCVWRNRPRRAYEVHGARDQRALFVYVREDALRRLRLRTTALNLTRGAELKLPWHTLSDSDLALVQAAMQLDSRRDPTAEGEPRIVHTFFMGEQAPDPESRVTLTDSRDAMGMPRVELRSRVSDADIASLYEVVGLFARRMASAGDGRLRIPVPEAGAREVLDFGAHHMGTTRMHASPRRGVVDADCRLHEVHNLHLAGSSVFPTCGAANPTFTILALVLRLADRLGRLLERPA